MDLLPPSCPKIIKQRQGTSGSILLKSTELRERMIIMKSLRHFTCPKCGRKKAYIVGGFRYRTYVTWVQCKSCGVSSKFPRERNQELIRWWKSLKPGNVAKSCESGYLINIKEKNQFHIISDFGTKYEIEEFIGKDASNIYRKNYVKQKGRLKND